MQIGLESRTSGCAELESGVQKPAGCLFEPFNTLVLFSLANIRKEYAWKGRDPRVDQLATPWE